MSLPVFRVASYNLQKCIGWDLRRRPDRSLKVIEATGAPLVVLQEADKRLQPRPAALPHDLLEAHGWRALPFGAPGGSLGWHGNAMIMRPDLGILDTAHIELPGLEPRGAVCADLETPVGPLRVLGLHLGLVRRYRILQLTTIIRALRDLPQRPTLLAGDFNEWGTGRDLQAVLRGFRLVSPGASFPSPRPVAPLDRFAIGPGLALHDRGALRKSPARVASDHLPVWAEIAPDRP